MIPFFMHHVILLFRRIHVFLRNVLPLIYIIIILYQHFSNLFYSRIL